MLDVTSANGGHGLNITWHDSNVTRLNASRSLVYYIVRAMFHGRCNALVFDGSSQAINVYETHVSSPDFREMVSAEFNGKYCDLL